MVECVPYSEVRVPPLSPVSSDEDIDPDLPCLFFKLSRILDLKKKRWWYCPVFKWWQVFLCLILLPLFPSWMVLLWWPGVAHTLLCGAHTVGCDALQGLCHRVWFLHCVCSVCSRFAMWLWCLENILSVVLAWGHHGAHPHVCWGSHFQLCYSHFFFPRH